MEERCLNCGRKYNVAVLRKHTEECPGGPSAPRSRSRSPIGEGMVCELMLVCRVFIQEFFTGMWEGGRNLCNLNILPSVIESKKIWEQIVYMLNGFTFQ